MVYVSYFEGVFITELNEQTGKLKNGGEGELIAKTGRKNRQAIKGPTIMYNPKTGWFYLMISYGWLGDTYNVRVGRSKNVTGPYLDYSKKNLKDIPILSTSIDTGIKILSSYKFKMMMTGRGPGTMISLKDGNHYFLFIMPELIK